VFSVVVADGGEAADGLRGVDGPWHLDGLEVRERCVRDRALPDGEEADGRQAVRGRDFLLRVERLLDHELHVALSGAEPDLSPSTAVRQMGPVRPPHRTAAALTSPKSTFLIVICSL